MLDNPLVQVPPRKKRLGGLFDASGRLASSLWESALALLPIVLVVGFFQLVVLRQPLPDIGGVIWGAVLVLLGLTLFIRGLKMALFPIGEEMAYDFVSHGNPWWLLLFAFTLGFGTRAARRAIKSSGSKMTCQQQLYLRNLQALQNLLLLL